MANRKKKVTPDYARLHCGGLTLSQQNAVALLVAGKNDTETAAVLGLNRVTVTRWRLYSPAFQAELNVRRAELWAVAGVKLQVLVSQALDVLAEGVREGDFASRFAAAREVLKLAGQPPAPAVGPIDPADIVRLLVHERREAAVRDDDNRELTCDLPSFEDQFGAVWQELDDRAGRAEPSEGGAVARLPGGSVRPVLGALTMSPAGPQEGDDRPTTRPEPDGE